MPCTEIAELEAQPVLQPGEVGWWKVWGARVGDVRTGDIVIINSASGEGTDAFYITDTFTAKSIAAAGFVDQDGARFTLGRLCRIVLVRKGTHNTLAASI